MTVEEIFDLKCNDNSDICQHLPTLRKYAEECKIVVELGVRSIVSTWAFLAAKPEILISVDIWHPSKYKDYDPGGCDLELVEELAHYQCTAFKFIEEDSRTVDLPVCDLMFFDTLHTYDQLKAELKKHGGNVRKYMIFHDTETYKYELLLPIEKFLDEHPEWMIKDVFHNNNGLLILTKI